MKTGEQVGRETEIWVREDGTVYARNLTSGMAAVLATLDRADTRMHWRARAGEEKADGGVGKAVGQGNEKGER
jgi:hypothetical protein